jgi:hypothetical protein
MTFSSLETAMVTVAFFVPGFIWSTVVAMLVPVRTSQAQVRLIELLAFSAVNHGLWLPLWVLIYRNEWYESHPYFFAVALFAMVIVSPAALGAVTGLFHQRRFISRMLGSLGIRAVDPVPHAWDWQFARGQAFWVVVTLNDESRIYGLYHERSFASSDEQHRDLYLEQQFRLVNNDEWAPVEDNAGVLIMGEHIRLIEFREYPELPR